MEKSKSAADSASAETPLEILKTTWTGTRPLIMSNPQTVQISNPFTAESRRLNSLIKAARKKDEFERLVALEKLQMRNDWESTIYWDFQQRQFYLPDTVILACIRAGAAAGRNSKDIDRGVLIQETTVYIDTKKVASIDEAYADESFVLSGPCRIPPKTGALVWKCRCMIPTGWKMTFHIEYTPDIITREALIRALERSSTFCGIGGWRPKFGRFLVEVK
jgi:hypothetical protein